MGVFVPSSLKVKTLFQPTTLDPELKRNSLGLSCRGRIRCLSLSLASGPGRQIKSLLASSPPFFVIGFSGSSWVCVKNYWNPSKNWHSSELLLLSCMCKCTSFFVCMCVFCHHLCNSPLKPSLNWLSHLSKVHFVPFGGSWFKQVCSCWDKNWALYLLQSLAWFPCSFIVPASLGTKSAKSCPLTCSENEADVTHLSQCTSAIYFFYFVEIVYMYLFMQVSHTQKKHTFLPNLHVKTSLAGDRASEKTRGRMYTIKATCLFLIKCQASK